MVRDGVFDFLHKARYANRSQTLTFIAEKKYVSILRKNSNISSVICTEIVADQIRRESEVGIIIHEKPRELFYKVHLCTSSWNKEDTTTFISSTAKIAPSAVISPKNVQIGENCVIEDGAIIKPGVSVGDGTKIRSGVVLGAEGFEITRVDGKPLVIPHLGKLKIGENVDIFSNSTICKSIFLGSENVIADEVFIDCLVHVAHGVTIGRGTKVAAHATIAGNVSIGENAWIGPGTTISNGIDVGNDAFIALGSVVISDVVSGQKVSGNFAIDHQENLLSYSKAKQ